MIEVRFDYSENALQMSVTGHAESRVCAASSILFRTLHAYCTEAGNGGAYVHEESGNGVFITTDRDAMPFFHMIELGYRTLACSYPDGLLVTTSEN